MKFEFQLISSSIPMKIPFNAFELNWIDFFLIELNMNSIIFGLK